MITAMTSRRRGSVRDSRGVALIEALVAMLVMAFGMVAVAGIMGTMRRSADLAKQRGEALRLAQQQMEQLRDYSLLAEPDPLDAFPNQRVLATSLAEAAVTKQFTSTELGSNTDYTLTQQVKNWSLPVDLPARTVRINMSWVDRAGDSQSINLDTFVAAADPSLSASLSVPPVYTATQRTPDGRSALPPGIKDRHDGTSVYKPQGSAGTVALIFNNLTGVITSRCAAPAGKSTLSLLSSDLTSCVPLNGYALWGYINFAGASSLSAANLAASIAATHALPLDMSVIASTGMKAAPTSECYDDGPVDATDPLAATQTTTSYLCVVTPEAVTVRTTTSPSETRVRYVWTDGGSITVTSAAPTPAPTSTKTVISAATGWFGDLQVGGIPFSGTPAWQICRYSGDYDGNGAISNAEHPLDYRLVQGALGNQNFLVIKAAETCPTGVSGTSGSAFFKTATVAHQPTGVDTTP